MNIPVESFSRVIDIVHHQYPVDHTLFLGFEECVIEVRLNDLHLLDTLKNYFSRFVILPVKADILVTVHQADVEFDTAYTIKQPDCGKSKIKEEYADFSGGRIVRKRLTNMHFLFNGKTNAAVGPCLENDNQVINFINNRFIEWKVKRGCLLGHAAGVMHKNRGLALAGFSGMGKSTLALKLMSLGTCFISNDRLLIEKRNDVCRMSGVAKLPRVNPGTVLNNDDLCCIIPDADRFRFKQMTTEALWELEHKFDADIEKCFGPDKFSLSAPMNGLVILNWQRDNTPLMVNHVKIDDRHDLLAAFMKKTGLFYLPKTDDPAVFPPEAYLNMLRDVPLIELSGGVDFVRASDICMNFLEHG